MLRDLTLCPEARAARASRVFNISARTVSV